MQFTYEYLRDNYKTLEILRSTETYRVELVLGTDRNTYIRRSIKNNITPYDKLLEVVSPFVAKTYYVAQQKQTTLILEEYIKGASLQELLDQKKTFNEEQAKQIALDLSYGLEALHAKGIIHRDIKPSNIILQEDGHLKLIDFNASRLKKEDRKHDTKILGTEGYAPPEQYGFMPTDERSDWYAVGKTLAELLGPDYQGQLTPLIEKCTRFDPQDRVKNAQEFRELLKEKRKKQWLILSLVIALAVGVGAYWFVQGSTVKEEPVDKVPEVKVEEKKAKEVTKDAASGSKLSQSDKNLKTTEGSTKTGKEVGRTNQEKAEWTERKKKLDATTPLRMLENNGLDLKAIGPENKYPRELVCDKTTVLQPIRVFQREKAFEQAFVAVDFLDFTIIPPREENVPYLGRYKEYMTFMEQGDVTLGVGINLSHYWKQHWEPYSYFGPVIGTNAFKYYQLGPNPRIRAKLVFLDGQTIVKTAPVRIH